MRLTVVGCGDAFGSGGRFNTCFKLDAEDASEVATILVDCGASTPVALKRLGLSVNDIDGIVLSHLHGDHFGGLPFFMLDSRFHARRERPLTIAGPPGTRERFAAAMEVFFPGSSGTEWRFDFGVVEIPLDADRTILGFDVRTTQVVHKSGAPSTALRLARGGKLFAYSGDTEWTDKLPAIAEGADLFVLECYDYDRNLPGHMSFTRLLQERHRFNAGRILLTHMNPTMLARTDEARAAGFLVAEDGMVVEV